MTISNRAVRLCDASIQVHSRSFSLAARFLPRPTRARAVVLYAWCRRADDLVDQTDGAAGTLALGSLHAELNAIYRGEPMGDLALDAFREVIEECRIPRRYPEELLAGLAMDVQGQRYRTMAELLQYSYRVAGTVGLMMCHVMGVKDEAAVRNAIHLGIAMQLTNIARDVLEDWERGRLYLPDELLHAQGLSGLTAGQGKSLESIDRQRLARVVLSLLDEADRYYRSGDRGMPALSTRCALAIRTARHVYAEIGTVLRARGGDPLLGRAVVGRGRKLLLTERAIAQTGAELPRRVWARWSGQQSETIPARELCFPQDVLPL